MKRCSWLIIVTLTLAACAGTAQPAASPLASPVMTPTTRPPAAVIVSTEQSGPAPTATSGRVAVFPDTIIVYQREGGFAGTSDKWTVYQTGRIVAGDGTEWQVPVEQVAPLFKLAESPAFGELNEKYEPAGACNDCFTYTLTVYGPSQPQTVTFIDGAYFPPLVQQMLTQLNTVTAPPPK